MTTIKDIAEKLGISPGTVSKGLNGGKDISEALRKTILDTAVELGYQNRKAAKISNRKLAMFLTNMEYKNRGDFGYDLVLGFKQAAAMEKWAVDLIPLDHAFQESIRYDSYMIEQNYSGAFIVGFSRSDPWLEQFSATTIPTALLDNYLEKSSKVCCIGTDSDEGLDLAVEHLIGLGHEKIAFLDGSRDSMISDKRMTAYLRSMIRNHLTIDPAFAVYSYFVAEAAHYHVPSLIEAGATAILCGNDLIASGVIDSLKELGLAVPEDVSVIGYDDIPLSSELEPALTTIRQDRLSLGKSAYYALSSMTNQVAPSMILLRPRLILRSSTGKAKPRLVTNRSIDKDSVLYVNPELYAQRF